LLNKWALLSYAVVAMFDNERAKCQSRSESGGILIGAYRGPHLEILNFTVPGPKDLRQRYGFVRQDPSHQRSATRIWKRSGGKDTFVGEWHTHPLGSPEPSKVDRQAWRDITVAAQRIMVFAVVAPLGWRLFWCERKWSGITIAPMNIVEHGQTGIVLRPKARLFLL
jgi:integrative and conjugative element protein (TIGR02256 family)